MMIHYHSELFNLERKTVDTFRKRTKIAFYKDLRMCVVPIIKLQPLNSIVEKDTVTFVSKDTTYISFVFRKTDKFGLSYTFDNFKNEKGKIFKVDSLLQDLTLREQDLKSLSTDFGEIIETVENDGARVEKILVKKLSPQDPDSIFRYYNKDLEGIDFTFSKDLDKKNNSKLYKTLFIFNPINKGLLSNDGIPSRQIYYEMYKIIDKPQIYKDIFIKFIKDLAK